MLLSLSNEVTSRSTNFVHTLDLGVTTKIDLLEDGNARFIGTRRCGIVLADDGTQTLWQPLQSPC